MCVRFAKCLRRGQQKSDRNLLKTSTKSHVKSCHFWICGIFFEDSQSCKGNSHMSLKKPGKVVSDIPSNHLQLLHFSHLEPRTTQAASALPGSFAGLSFTHLGGPDQIPSGVIKHGWMENHGKTIGRWRFHGFYIDFMFCVGDFPIESPMKRVDSNCNV